MGILKDPRRIPLFLLILAIVSSLILLSVMMASIEYHVEPGEDMNTKIASSLYPLDLPDILFKTEDTKEYAIYGPQANANWLDTTPSSNGYLHIGEDHRFFALAFGHELHCIRVLRMAIAYPLHPYANADHGHHCLNYLRNYILCNPDLTLEKFDPLEDDFTVERFGATHVCRDWRLVYDELSRAQGKWVAFYGMNSTE